MANSLFGQSADSYPSQVKLLDSLYNNIYHLDSAVSLQKLHDLYQSSLGQEDKNYSFLIKILILNHQVERGLQTPGLKESIHEVLDEAQLNHVERIRADALQMAGNFYWNRKSYAQALEHYLYGSRIYETFGLSQFPRKLIYLKDLAAKFYFFTDYATAKDYLLEFWKILPKEQQSKNISPINTLGLCYSNLQVYDSSEYFFNQAENIARLYHDEEWIGIISGNKANIYYQQGKLEMALPLFEKDVSISLQRGSHMSAALSVATCGSIYMTYGQADKAIEYILKARDIINNKINRSNILVRAKVYPIIAKVFAERGMTREAYLYLDSANAAKDTMTRQKSLLYLMGARNKVEAEKHLDELREKEAEVNEQKLIRNGLIVGSICLLLFAAVFFVQRNRIKKEKLRTDELLLNILPSEVADELKEKGSAEARQYEDVTVMFTDFKDFTKISENLTPKQLVADIHSYFEAFDKIISKYTIEKIKTIGDSYMCAGGLPVANNTHALDVVRAAWDLQEYMNQCKKDGKDLYDIRIGIHTGPVVAGIVGVMKFAYDIWGDTVNTASRLETAGEAGKINISGSTYEMVKDHFRCTYRGKVEAKHKGLIDMYFVDGKI
ncbi:MAG: hypothetical protein IPM92_04490 [Saprospiraceae bacterium]|nr:hypothetical protein [Saprospiraceae bacterium]